MAITKFPQSKFYQEDIVQDVDEPSRLGIVLRCWFDNNEIPVPEVLQEDPLLRPLKPGEVGVSFFPELEREITSESKFRLVDRQFQTGDVCKRHIEDVQSGVVTSVDVRFKAAHAISNEKIEEWLTKDDIADVDNLDVGRTVIYGDWVGQVQEMFDEMIVKCGDGGSFIRVPEICSRLAVGDRGKDVLPPQCPEHSSHMHAIQPSSNDTVIAIKHTILAVGWLAVNQKLSPEEAASRQRPQRFWKEDEQHKLTLIRELDEKVVHVGSKVTLRNPPFVTRHGDPTVNGTQIVVDTYNVCDTQTTVTVLWQDGSTEVVNSKDLIPYLNPDEYDCWPGDHVMWKTEDGQHPAVIQRVDAKERTAQIMLYSGKSELVPVLELDVHGSDVLLEMPHDSFGVHMGDLVFIHGEGRTNGFEKPMVPVIGEIEAWVYEPALQDNGEFSGWRKELSELGRTLARSPTRVSGFTKAKLSTDSSINWFGEVVKLHLNGLIDVQTPSQQILTLPLESLSRLNDGLEQLEAAWGDGFDDGFDDDMDQDGDGEILTYQTEDGEWHEYEPEEEGDWVDDDEDDEALSSTEEVTNMDTIDIISTESSIQETVGSVSRDTPSSSDSNRPISQPSSKPTTADESMNGQSSWNRFDILPSVPIDHAFYSSIPVEPSRQFMSRLSKEYKALTSSLPESITVRTYEDRTDLLRCMIIGPDNTPYEDAPFVIDWMLDSNFPQSPPIAHFHSWTNGNGRVNPNLYEEGKVCLSILGTWAGDRTESWSASRSSLLQAFVSIQGLVLVKEPWFCEPAYDKLRGTAEAKVNSRLYSEKAFVLSRGFVRRALEMPVGGLEEVINDIYFTKGRLTSVITKAMVLIAKSQGCNDSEFDDDGEIAVPRLTAGGALALSRTMAKLEQIQSSSHQSNK